MSTLRRTFVLAGLLALSVFSAPVSAQVDADPTHRFALGEVFSIGGDESAPPESLFRNLAHLRTDTDGRIYVVEGRGVGSPPGTEIHVFGPSGAFLETLGRSGGGPGEFRDIQAIAIDDADRLVVYDRQLDRFTRYPPFETIDSFPRPTPDRIETIPNPEDFRILPAFMYGLPDGHFVLFYQPPKGQRAADQPRLHRFNERLEKVGAFGQPGKWALPDDEVGQYFLQSPFSSLGENGHVAPGTSSLVLAPPLYQGRLYRYVRGEDGGWSLQRLEGRDPGHPTHEVVESSDEPYSFFSSGGIGARYRSASKGVGQLRDGRVVHLSTAEDETGTRQLQLELFGPDGTLRKVGRIDGFVHDKEEFEAVQQAVSIELLWVDRDNRLYLNDRRGGFPVIRVMRFDE